MCIAIRTSCGHRICCNLSVSGLGEKLFKALAHGFEILIRGPQQVVGIIACAGFASRFDIGCGLGKAHGADIGRRAFDGVRGSCGCG